ncbi:ABC transporter ATP-binding protein [Pleionea sp. CnH1-48]|uniref:ABC transporter ATP-binding protein n=1 Tax=Pleionea sp. CnH1-48 TaxID=2954494 RepID=UPI002097B8C7|nr:ABC transporter ATP-binding protein [Pleionea sp. CnH1-48]MCO7225531.1 ABC transporter ATP-binding protein [Pleionea sp. CnH1-48]
MLVVADSLCKYYSLGENQVTALDNVSFSIDKGEFVVIKGASGSGKSTLLNILGAMDEPCKGSLAIDGVELNQLNERRRSHLRRDQIGFIFQAFNLIPVLTAVENVVYPLSLSRAKDAKERAMDALDKVGLKAFAAHRPGQLSGGQMQRVAIARAIVTQPNIILADEPTANLDSETSANIMLLMEELNKQSDITFIIATHHDYVMSLASRIIEMKDGRIISDLQRPNTSASQFASDTHENELEVS